MLRTKRQGFTLIELMVVIVIIGVLSTLAIPRFTQASDRAKVAEAPRVIASYESGYLAAVAELGTVSAIDQVVFEIPGATTATPATGKSKFFEYVASETDFSKFRAEPLSDIGKYKKADGKMGTTYVAADNAFDRCAPANAVKLAPNFNNKATGTLATSCP